MKECIPPNRMEWKIAGITISFLLFNLIMRKYESAGKDNIQIIKNKIQTLSPKIKGMGIDHFHENVNSLNAVLSEHGMLILNLMHQLFKVYKVCEGSTS